MRCAKDGVVVRSRIVTDSSDRTSEWGNYVAVQSGERVIYYCHLSKRLVSVGDAVAEGDVLGIEGSTGRSTGSHLHFEVRENNIAVNPAEFLGIPNEVGFTVNRGDDSVGSAGGSDINAGDSNSGKVSGNGSDGGDNSGNNVGSVGNDGSVASPWAADGVKWAVDNGILLGDGCSLRLRDGITREESAVMLHRMFVLIEKEFGKAGLDFFG